MEPPIFFLEMGWGHPPIPTHPVRRGDRGDTIPHSNAPPYPISHHIDEDALEGLYFAFSLILRCLPYFLRKTRPRGSYDLLEAFLPSCGGLGGSAGLLSTQIRAHLGAWNPESRSIYHTRAGNPNPGWGRPGSSIRRSIQRATPRHIPIPPPSSPPHPYPAAPHPRTHAPHTQAPTPKRPHQTKKKFKKKLATFVFCAYSAAITR